jgi:hypothetical protein
MAELRPISTFNDEAPKDGTVIVLALMKDGEVEDMTEGHWSDDGKFYIDALCDFRASHWFIPDSRA